MGVGQHLLVATPPRPAIPICLGRFPHSLFLSSALPRCRFSLSCNSFFALLFILLLYSFVMSFPVGHRGTRILRLPSRQVRSQASNVGVGSSGYDASEDHNSQNLFVNSPSSESSSETEKRPNRIPYPLSIAMVLLGSALVFSLIMFVKGGPSSILAAIAKSGFAAAFMLIFVSEIGDKEKVKTKAAVLLRA
ncbi:hypothetical protein Cgig2_013952 [Carnegiea gigantea]|uniref:GDT1 family protein n=1 Tax=Carnegiea gigantea TaxID=171969 RepID=A0A9Q1KY41_9CARY|nr:hypothetical protein Cgig2_013952 [Carnegiea gigantea]